MNVSNPFNFVITYPILLRFLPEPKVSPCMKRYPLLLLLLFVLTGAGMYVSSVQLDYFNLERQENDFILTWQMRVEQDVRSYALSRKTGYSEDYTQIRSLAPHGINKPYTHRDDQVYKAASEQVVYRLEALFMDGSRQILGERQMNYTPTAARRTWGSIKAMFQ